MEHLREYRQTRGWTQAQLAELLGVARPHLSRLESGRRQPSAALLARIVQVLELSAEEQAELLRSLAQDEEGT